MANQALAIRRPYARAVPGTGHPRPLTPAQAWHRALSDLQYFDEAVYQAHRAVIAAKPGRMLAAVAVWRAAEQRLALAVRLERRCRLEASGQRWLRVVGGRDA